MDQRKQETTFVSGHFVPACCTPCESRRPSQACHKSPFGGLFSVFSLQPRCKLSLTVSFGCQPYETAHWQHWSEGSALCSARACFKRTGPGTLVLPHRMRRDQNLIENVAPDFLTHGNSSTPPKQILGQEQTLPHSTAGWFAFDFIEVLG